MRSCSSVANTVIDELRGPAAKEKQLADEYREEFANPFGAAGRGHIEAVIRPSETRAALIQALDVLETKNEARPARKHGNVPL